MNESIPTSGAWPTALAEADPVDVSEQDRLVVEDGQDEVVVLDLTASEALASGSEFDLVEQAIDVPLDEDDDR